MNNKNLLIFRRSHPVMSHPTRNCVTSFDSFLYLLVPFQISINFGFWWDLWNFLISFQEIFNGKVDQFRCVQISVDNTKRIEIKVTLLVHKALIIAKKRIIKKYTAAYLGANETPYQQWQVLKIMVFNCAKIRKRQEENNMKL